MNADQVVKLLAWIGAGVALCLVLGGVLFGWML